MLKIVKLQSMIILVVVITELGSPEFFLVQLKNNINIPLSKFSKEHNFNRNHVKTL